VKAQYEVGHERKKSIKPIRFNEDVVGLSSGLLESRKADALATMIVRFCHLLLVG